MNKELLAILKRVKEGTVILQRKEFDYLLQSFEYTMESLQAAIRKNDETFEEFVILLSSLITGSVDTITYSAAVLTLFELCNFEYRIELISTDPDDDLPTEVRVLYEDKVYVAPKLRGEHVFFSQDVTEEYLNEC